MNTAFRKSFETDLAGISDPALLRRIRKVIEQVEAAQTFQQIPNIKRLEATGKYYAFAWATTGLDLCSNKVS